MTFPISPDFTDSSRVLNNSAGTYSQNPYEYVQGYQNTPYNGYQQPTPPTSHDGHFNGSLDDYFLRKENHNSITPTSGNQTPTNVSFSEDTPASRKKDLYYCAATYAISDTTRNIEVESYGYLSSGDKDALVKSISDDSTSFCIGYNLHNDMSIFNKVSSPDERWIGIQYYEKCQYPAYWGISKNRYAKATEFIESHKWKLAVG
ncbi:uncharacterized protein I206_103182 [Kwoniella pini CBS 10737]|uniref:Uncharacterized protein n=1 Tax=Kwoniella pini CBS 10737 TaxID=1296096 RepID=A0A1B9IAM1_9TREE|nr:uncharacterized protein I206_01814 [Kwoniella pini CBS 10737]OCF52523.1 hypothetical protein I206_01814 [Kwoniella pini CBS 10737]